MTPQDHASHLLRIWQERKHLPPDCRLSDVPFSPCLDEAMAKAAPRIVQVGDHDIERFVA